jgi:hypothetical protein
MINDFFVGVCMIAFNASWAHINVTPFFTWKWLDVRTRKRPVLAYNRITTQPASIGLNMSKATHTMIMLISFRAPQRSEGRKALLFYPTVS